MFPSSEDFSPSVLYEKLNFWGKYCKLQNDIVFFVKYINQNEA